MQFGSVERKTSTVWVFLLLFLAVYLLNLVA
jgi:hypothetical protein